MVWAVLTQRRRRHQKVLPYNNLVSIILVIYSSYHIGHYKVSHSVWDCCTDAPAAPRSSSLSTLTCTYTRTHARTHARTLGRNTTQCTHVRPHRHTHAQCTQGTRTCMQRNATPHNATPRNAHIHACTHSRCALHGTYGTYGARHARSEARMRKGSVLSRWVSVPCYGLYRTLWFEALVGFVIL